MICISEDRSCVKHMILKCEKKSCHQISDGGFFFFVETINDKTR